MRRQLAQLKREGPPAYVTILNEMRDGISRGKPITRNDLWINTGLNRNTIDMAIKGLLRKGVITRVSYGIYRLAGRSDAPGQPPATSARSSKGAGPSAQL
jgi:hypothetical protein